MVTWALRSIQQLNEKQTLEEKLNENQLQANPNYVIEELVTQNAKLSQENAMLRAVIREQEEQQNNEKTSAEGE